MSRRGFFVKGRFYLPGWHRRRGKVRTDFGAKADVGIRYDLADGTVVICSIGRHWGPVPSMAEVEARHARRLRDEREVTEALDEMHKQIAIDTANSPDGILVVG